MDTVTRFQILDETDCISHSTNTLGEGMNLISLPPATLDYKYIFTNPTAGAGCDTGLESEFSFF